MRPWLLLTLYLAAVAAVSAIGWTLATHYAAGAEMAKYRPFPGQQIRRPLYTPGMAAKPYAAPWRPHPCHEHGLTDRRDHPRERR